MDEVFSKLEEGLEAFEKLEYCMNLFPNYDLKKDLKESYVEKENAIVKKFIKTGILFVKKDSEEVKNCIAYMKNNEEAFDIDKSEHDEYVQAAVGLSQSNNAAHESIKTSAEESENCDKECKNGEEESENGDKESKNGEEESETSDENSENEVRRKKKVKKKKSKYHLRLVKEQGLPPSRLMQQQH